MLRLLLPGLLPHCLLLFLHFPKQHQRISVRFQWHCHIRHFLWQLLRIESQSSKYLYLPGFLPKKLHYMEQSPLVLVHKNNSPHDIPANLPIYLLLLHSMHQWQWLHYSNWNYTLVESYFFQLGGNLKYLALHHSY